MQFEKFKKYYKLNKKVAGAFYTAYQLNKDNDLGPALDREAYKIIHCADFVNSLQCDNCGAHHFKSFYRCKSKYCYNCNAVKSSLWTAKLYAYIKEWLKCGKYVIFLNFTVRDRDSLSDGLSVLNGAWQQLTSLNHKTRDIFKDKFVGGFRGIEVKIGDKSNQWHPHIHSICLKEHYSKDTDFLSYAWPLSILRAGGSEDERNYFISAFSPYRSTDQDVYSYELRLLKSIRECVKYISKFDFQTESPERLTELYSNLRGARQFSTWGVLYNIQQEIDDLMNNASDEEIKDFVCQVCGSNEFTERLLSRLEWSSEHFENLSTSLPTSLSQSNILLSQKLNNKTKLPVKPKIDQLKLPF